MFSTPAISVQNLRKVYGAKAAVDGLDLEVPRGCFFGFLGPNGAGKTTTIRMLMGLAPPTSGTIELLGRPMPERALEVKQKIGLVPDESLLFDHLTGLEFTEFVGRMYGLSRLQARERAREPDSSGLGNRSGLAVVLAVAVMPVVAEQRRQFMLEAAGLYSRAMHAAFFRCAGLPPPSAERGFRRLARLRECRERTRLTGNPCRRARYTEPR